LLEEWSCVNDDTAWTEDSISVWRSSNATLRNGLVDGNNSPTGVGVMFEGDSQEAAEGARPTSTQSEVRLRPIIDRSSRPSPANHRSGRL